MSGENYSGALWLVAAGHQFKKTCLGIIKGLGSEYLDIFLMAPGCWTVGVGAGV